MRTLLRSTTTPITKLSTTSLQVRVWRKHASEPLTDRGATLPRRANGQIFLQISASLSGPWPRRRSAQSTCTQLVPFDQHRAASEPRGHVADGSCRRPGVFQSPSEPGYGETRQETREPTQTEQPQERLRSTGVPTPLFSIPVLPAIIREVWPYGKQAGPDTWPCR